MPAVVAASLVLAGIGFASIIQVVLVVGRARRARAWPTLRERTIESGYRAERYYTGQGLRQRTRFAVAIAYEYEVADKESAFGRRRRRPPKRSPTVTRWARP
ncbi:MAG TPA: hypothetical protein VFL91_18620 [Thermomicrobiales bacterium]|nr:hypothetical protein [Thermomicrobiales bacterium]